MAFGSATMARRSGAVDAQALSCREVLAGRVISILTRAALAAGRPDRRSNLMSVRQVSPSDTYSQDLVSLTPGIVHQDFLNISRIAVKETQKALGPDSR